MQKKKKRYSVLSGYSYEVWQAMQEDIEPDCEVVSLQEYKEIKELEKKYIEVIEYKKAA